MTELRGFDFDGETSRAWRSFAARLADHLADMEDRDTLEIGLVGLPSEAPGSEPSAVTFTGCEESLLSADVTVGSPAGAGGDDRLTTRAGLQLMLAELGWRPPDLEHAEPADEAIDGPLHTRLVVPCREADHLASLTVRLLCEVLGAVHPVFLRVSGDRDLVPRSPDGSTIASEVDLAPPGVTEPTDSAHLRDLVTRTIAADLGTEPTRDRDGDIVLEAGSSRVFVRVLESTPVISVFTRLVHHITRPVKAGPVVARLNADYSFVKFILGDDAVIACVHLPASPFVPAQLRRMAATFAELANHLDDELVRRLGGKREIEPAAEDLEQGSTGDEGEALPEGVPPELLTLLRLDPDGVGLDAELTAKICGYDKALTWQLLHIAGGQEAVWQAAAEEDGANADHEARCADEAEGWKATRRSLAEALELINANDG